MRAPTSTVDLTDVETFAGGHHHAVFRRLREHDPVHLHRTADGGTFWALTRYRDVAAAYTDHATFSSSRGAMLGGSFRSDRDSASGRMLVAADPPRHRLLRRVMHHLFAADNVARIRHQVDTLVDAAVSRMLASGGADFATDVAPELPAGALMVLLDVSHARAHELIGLTRRMVGYRDPAFAEAAGDDRLHLAAVQAEMFEFFTDLIARRRRGPGDDLVSILLAARLNGRALSDEEIIYNGMNVSVGGNETSSYTACSGLQALLGHPGQARLLERQPELLDLAIGEMLRWGSTNAYVQRVAVRDVVIAGRQIRAGDSVTLWNVSANRDGEQFPDPDTFRITRTPNRHLTYGMGVHRCIGSALAHTELTALFTRLAPVLPRLRPAGPVRALRSNFILGTTSQPLAVG